MLVSLMLLFESKLLGSGTEDGVVGERVSGHGPEIIVALGDDLSILVDVTVGSLSASSHAAILVEDDVLVCVLAGEGVRVAIGIDAADSADSQKS